MLKTRSSIAILFSVLVACVLPARASIDLSAKSVTALPGSVGNSFEVDITNTGISAVEIGGFVFEITTTNPDVTFTDVTDATTAYSYIFTGNSLFGPDIAFSSPGQTFDAADNAATPYSFTALNPGATLGLGLVFFNVSPTATAPESVTVSFNLNDSSLADGNGDPLSIDGSQSGTIVVTPEPSGTVELIAGFGVLALLKSKARRFRDW